MLLASACGGDPVAKPDDSIDPSEADEADEADQADDTAGDDSEGVDVGDDSTPAVKDAAVKPPPTTTKDAGIDASSGPKTDSGTPAKPDTDTGTPSAGGKDGGGDEEPTGGPTTPTGSGDSSCLDSITDYTKDGPFKFAAKPSGSIKYWVPEVPAGCKVPVVHLANGTGASCSQYQPVLNRLASHGFLATCYENTNTGAGTQGLMAIETAYKNFPDLVAKKIGSTGHSQGGQGTFMVQVLAEQKFGLTDYIYAGLAMEPASGFGTQPSGGSWQSWYAKIKGPMFMFSGTADMLVSEGWVQRGFDAMAKDNETYHWSATGATHIPVPNSHSNDVVIPWFRWKLLGDKAACEAFKKLPGAGRWTKRKEQNVKECG
jgi:hypothetical protein